MYVKVGMRKVLLLEGLTKEWGMIKEIYFHNVQKEGWTCKIGCRQV